MRWTDLPIDRPVATVMVLVCLTVLGTVALFRIPLGYMPVIQEPEVDVEVPYPGAHPLEVLREVVRPIEEEVATIPGVSGIFGRTSPGNGFLEVAFDWSSDIELKKMEVRDAVERVRPQLPAGIGHVRVEGDTGGPGAEVLGGRISANRDLSESWDLLDRKLRRENEWIAARSDARLRHERNRDARVISRAIRAYYRDR